LGEPGVSTGVSTKKSIDSLYSVLSKKGIGIFAKEFSSYFKLMPVEDEDRLRDNKIRENFIKNIYIFKKMY